MSRPAPSAKRHRWLAGVASLAAHLGLASLFLSSVPSIPLPPTPVAAPIVVELVQPPRPVVVQKAPTPKPKAAPAAAAHASARPDPHVGAARPSPAAPVSTPLPAAAGPAGGSPEGLTDAQVAGASTVGEGPGGGGCDMARQVQKALRRDPLVQAQVAGAVRASAGRPIMVWNGDWVQSQGEAGKGLSAVREAIVWEIAFAPAACRAEPIRGLVMMSLNSSARLAVGTGQWRWSDLLRSRPGG